MDSAVNDATKLKGATANVKKLSDLASQTARTRTEYFNNFNALKLAAANPKSVQEVKAVLLQPITKRNIAADLVFQRNQAALIQAATVKARIVGIDAVPAPEFPDCFSVVIEMGDKRGLCTGTLVASNVVVTAAHCCEGTVKAVYNANNTFTPRISGEYMDVTKAVRHPRYNSQTLTDDVAFLILRNSITAVAPRPFAPPGAINRVQTVRVVGYGATTVDGQKGSGTRRQVDVAVINPVGAAWPEKAFTYGCHPDLEFVAAKDRFGGDTCDGDSGGPAYVEMNGNYYLVGATSRPIKDAPTRCGSGGIYERLEKYEEWIKKESIKHGGIW